MLSIKQSAVNRGALREIHLTDPVLRRLVPEERSGLFDVRLILQLLFSIHLLMCNRADIVHPICILHHLLSILQRSLSTCGRPMVALSSPCLTTQKKPCRCMGSRAMRTYSARPSSVYDFARLTNASCTQSTAAHLNRTLRGLDLLRAARCFRVSGALVH